MIMILFVIILSVVCVGLFSALIAMSVHYKKRLASAFASLKGVRSSAEFASRSLEMLCDTNNIYFWEIDLNANRARLGARLMRDYELPEYIDDYANILIEAGYVHRDSVKEYKRLDSRLRAGERLATKRKVFWL